MFVVSMLYLVGLGVLAVLYFTDVIDPRDRIGTIPTPVPWFGALGAVIISLTGVFDHYADWLPSYRLWHWARPFIGAAVAVVAVLIFQAGVLAVGEDLNPGAGTSKDLFYYVIAFFVGYKEAAFREMISRVGDVILKPSEAGAVSAAAITDVQPRTAPAAGGTLLTIRGTGLSQTKSVTFDDTEATVDAVADSYLKLTTPAGTPGRVVITVIGRDDTPVEHGFEFT